jgi:hypothetical protein
MTGGLLLRLAALVGFLVATAGGTAYLYRNVPRAYPREATRLDERTYRVVRAALSLGVVLGTVGTALSAVDAVGTVRALEGGRRGLVAGLAILIPLGATRAMVYGGGALLVVAGLLAGAVELRNART